MVSWEIWLRKALRSSIEENKINLNLRGDALQLQSRAEQEHLLGSAFHSLVLGAVPSHHGGKAVECVLSIPLPKVAALLILAVQSL